MIILMERTASTEQVRDFKARVDDLGLELSQLDSKGHAFEVIGDERGRILALQGAPGVEAILTRRVALEGGEPVWPHFVLRGAILLLLLFTLLALLAAFAPPGLGDRAEPTSIASWEGPVEWYLRPLAGYLALFSGWLAPIGGVSVVLLWLVFLLWPFLDRADETTPRGRRVVLLMRVAGLALILFVIALGVAG